VHSDDRAHAEAVPRLAFGGTDAAGDWRVLRSKGTNSTPVDLDQMEEVWVHARVRHAKTVNVRTCVVTLTEIATHKANEMRLLHLATHDPLTGLPNRHAFVARVDRELARAARDQVTGLLFVDLDRFKQVNDRYGHLTGDRLLVAVARRIRATLRPFDTLGRLGGDELGIMCEVASPHDATRLAERIVDVVGEPFPIDDEILTIGASVGVATAAPGTSLSSSELIAAADHAMYRAKRAGGGQWWMRGAPTTLVRSRRALEQAHAALGRLAGEISRLQHSAADIQRDADSLSDDPLTERVAAIIDALERARGLATDHLTH
jgi:diguanylate cyclase (GGDEF)-like protein